MPDSPDTKALFETYEQAEREYEEARTRLEVLQKLKSEAVRAVQQHLGNGPFQFKGRLLTISHKGDSYFFKGKEIKVKVEV